MKRLQSKLEKVLDEAAELRARVAAAEAAKNEMAHVVEMAKASAKVMHILYVHTLDIYV